MSENLQLDPADWRILQVLQEDASISNKDLAARVGLPTSSCHERVRRLRASGVILGIRAVVDPAVLGRGLEAFIAVQLRPHSRERVYAFTRGALDLPQTLGLYNITGPEDFFLHVAVRDSAELQSLIVDHLATRPEVVHCQTHLVFGRPHLAPVRPLQG